MRANGALSWCAALWVLTGVAGAEPLEVVSPSSRVKLAVEVAGGKAVYSVRYGDREAIRPSVLGLVFEGAARLDSNFRIAKQIHGETFETWKPVYGERSEFLDRFRWLSVDFEETIPPRRTLTVDFRVYDEGVAFRYRIGDAAGAGAFVIGGESTEFRLPKGAYCWETPRAQTAYRRVLVEEMAQASERPLLLEIPGGVWAAIADAGVEDYSSMFLAGLGRAEPHSLGVKLMGPVQGRAPFASPWRVILLGGQPGELLEHNYLLQNLSPALRLRSTDWIKPGKVLREVTLSTRGGREAVDFAARHGLQYIEYDAGWYGHEYEEESDARRVSIDPRRLRKEPEYQGLDLPAVIQYARSKGIGVWLYVNRRAMERQLDELLPLYKAWGVAGVKYGFVNVHTQAWTRWLYEAVAKAGEQQLMLDIHDEFRPTGMSRAYPHLLTQEGVRGNEEFPDATQSTILPFTRMLAGAADHTFCWLDPRLKNTSTHQMALSVVIYSPLQFLYWYDRPVSFVEGEGAAGMEWFRELPTVWDDTRVVAGRPGEFAIVARRKGERWFVGAITNNEGRSLRVPLERLLPEGQAFRAVVYGDGEGELRDVRRSERVVRKEDSLELGLHARGGAAVILTPLDR